MLSANHGHERDRNQYYRRLKREDAQLRRLLAQRMWINEASKAALAELENQIAQIKTVLLELEKEIQDQLKRVL